MRTTPRFSSMQIVIPNSLKSMSRILFEAFMAYDGVEPSDDLFAIWLNHMDRRSNILAPYSLPFRIPSAHGVEQVLRLSTLRRQPRSFNK